MSYAKIFSSRDQESKRKAGHESLFPPLNYCLGRLLSQIAIKSNTVTSTI